MVSGKSVTLTVARDGSTITMTGGTEFAPSSLPLLTGTISSNGSVTASGSGTIADVSDVFVIATGTLVDDRLEIELTVGGEGKLPGGQSIQYSFGDDPN